MHSINLTQFKDDDDEIITTAETDPAALSVSVRTTGEIVDVDASVDKLRPLGVDGFQELFVVCAQAAFAHRYDPLLSENEH
ncbi:hypothetical protein [Mycobacterium xenopi]|uniref:hypothetical protein n=1 Tax=Mycobacterium xenopi TaxID=1789 RepID=UPI000A1595D5|nr:hypothetical protein [Mycobacterium xenopi]ORX14142.1 hypothetical protein AWC32_14260 [Mycobacterium xenopi]SPX94854.1 Uncharacterised protein [Mycobacterium xenopi]